MKSRRKRTALCVAAAVVFLLLILLLFCNFTDKYGVIPTDSRLHSCDKIPYVMLLYGIPEAVDYNAEALKTQLSYSKTVYGEEADVNLFFSRGEWFVGGRFVTYTGSSLCSIVYVFKGIDEENRAEFSEKIIDSIEKGLDESFTAQDISYEDETGAYAGRQWEYSGGARYEMVEYFVSGSEARIWISFQC